MAPALPALKARIFTFASLRILVSSASVPGRFSQETVSCFILGMTSPSADEFPACYQRDVSRSTKIRHDAAGEQVHPLFPEGFRGNSPAHRDGLVSARSRVHPFTGSGLRQEM